MPVIITGTIVDQLFYPKPAPTDGIPLLLQESIKQSLAAVSLGHIIDQRLGGSLERSLSITEWISQLSPGELQRLVLARLFLHLPTFAILDEATNAIEARMEMEIYELLWAAGITTVSISHRSGFVRDHAVIAVTMDGFGHHQIEMKGIVY